MRIGAINSANYKQNSVNRQTAFKAIMLKDDVLCIDTCTHSPISAAIVELETDTRELIADARRRHESDITEYGYQKRMKYWPDKVEIMDFLSRGSINSERDIYFGDYKLMEDLVVQNELPSIREINERVKENDMYHADLSAVDNTSIREYWNYLTEGKTKQAPQGYEGLLDKNLYGYLSHTDAVTVDSIIPGTVNESYINAPRQRILMAVKRQNNGDYRNLRANDVLGIAEIYTDRATDVVEEMAADGENVQSILEKTKLSADKINPVKINFMDYFRNLKGTGKALLEAICEKGKYCGVLADMRKSNEYNLFASAGFKRVINMEQNKILKPGLVKTRFIV